MIAEQYLNCSPSLFAQQELEIRRRIDDGDPPYEALLILVYKAIRNHLEKCTTDQDLCKLNEQLKEQPDPFGLCTSYAKEHGDSLDEKTKAVLELPTTIESLYVGRSYMEKIFQKSEAAKSKSSLILPLIIIALFMLIKVFFFS